MIAIESGALGLQPDSPDFDNQTRAPTLLSSLKLGEVSNQLQPFDTEKQAVLVRTEQFRQGVWLKPVEPSIESQYGHWFESEAGELFLRYDNRIESLSYWAQYAGYTLIEFKLRVQRGWSIEDLFNRNKRLRSSTVLEHGTRSRYQNQHCRCELCKAASKVYLQWLTRNKHQAREGSEAQKQYPRFGQDAPDCYWYRKPIGKRNKRIIVCYNGIEKPLTQWSQELGDLNRGALYSRLITLKWGTQKAIEEALLFAKKATGDRIRLQQAQGESHRWVYRIEPYHEDDQGRWFIDELGEHLVFWVDRLHTLNQWSEILGLKVATLRARLQVYRFPIEKAFTKPADHTEILHGSGSGYVYHKCRCELCKEANRALSRQYARTKQVKGLFATLKKLAQAAQEAQKDVQNV